MGKSDLKASRSQQERYNNLSGALEKRTKLLIPGRRIMPLPPEDLEFK